MKKALFILFGFLLCANTWANPKCEYRATWMTTGFSIDWPKSKTAETQKQELQQKLDALVAGNMNAVCLQVRSFSDAIYKSSYEPWAECLTGTRGQDPGYDPLAFAIEEAHKRGLELHVWVNPFRVTSSGTLDTEDLVWKNAGEWIIKYNNSSFKGQIIDPGYPEARAYVHKVFMEIVNNYDIDGILMDDYFYAYGGTYSEDSKSKSLYKPSNVKDVDQDGSTDDDWRRANVDSVICNLYKEIQKVKPWVRFGMGIPGNWSMKSNAAKAYGISLPSGISAMESYDYLYCNALEWVKQGWVDYINPQIYWSTQVTRQNYRVLCNWWAKTVCENFSNKLPNGKRVHFCASQAAYAVYDQSINGYEDGIAEIQRQIDANRDNLSSGYTGSVFFSTSNYILMHRELRESHFKRKALMPPLDWKVQYELPAPSNITVKDTVLSWTHPTAERFTVYTFPRGTKDDNAKNNPEYLKRVVYGKSCRIDGWGDLSQYTIAVYSYDRYGVEHAAAYYEGNEVYEPEVAIKWELNGGTVDVDLPTYVTELYVLPIPRKEGHDFNGWYNSKALRGNKITEIHAGWTGTLYAAWKKSATGLGNNHLNAPMQVYDLMGRYLGNTLPEYQHGVFIVIQGEERYKITL